MAMPQLVFDLPPGTIIDGRYKLLKALGQGGFGITYIAWDCELNRNVAVKECFPSGICLREPESGGVRPMRSEWEPMYLHALDNMRKEARTLASLNHESIVRIHDVIWGNGSVFCVMPWLSSGTLKQRMQEGAVTAEQSQQWLRRLLDALSYLHSRGIIHRDMKPDNIMFNEADIPVIIDFGAALNRPELTTTTTQGAFSRRYAAPEQLTGKGNIGPWTDFYALSATWYELLTGLQPESSDARLMQDDMALLSSVCRLNYPAKLVALLQLNLSLNPRKRCQSVEQWLACWKDGTLPEPDMPGGSKARYRSMLKIAAVAALLGGVGAAAWYALPAQHAALSLSAADPATVKKRLENKLRAFFKLDEFEAICTAKKERLPEWADAYEARANELMQRIEAALSQIKTAKAAHQLAQQAVDEYSKLSIERADAANRMLDEFYAEIKPFRLDATEMSADFHPDNMEEAALLPSVCAEQENRCQMLHNSVTVPMTELSSMSKEAENRSLKLLKLISEKATELDHL